MSPTAHSEQQHRAILQRLAHKAMLERELLPDFSAAVLAELDKIQAPANMNDESDGDASEIRDLTGILWASIDNDDSRDLDQLTVAESLPGHKVKIGVAIADVDALVKEGSAIDEHARHNTTAEDAANKVERQVGKSAAALLIESRIGEQFEGIVTGASAKGTWVRLLHIPVEGRVMHGFEGIDVGDRIHAQLISTNVERGFIDFKRVGSAGHE